MESCSFSVWGDCDNLIWAIVSLGLLKENNYVTIIRINLILTRAHIDVRMSMEKNSFQTITPQTARVVKPPQTPKTLEIPVAGAIVYQFF